MLEKPSLVAARHFITLEPYLVQFISSIELAVWLYRKKKAVFGSEKKYPDTTADVKINDLAVLNLKLLSLIGHALN